MCECFFDGVEVGECEFGVDYFDVVDWVDFVGDVNDVFVFEVVYDVCDCVGFVDVCEELVVEVFIFVCVCDEVCDVDEFDDGWYDMFWFDDFGECF